MPKPADRIPSQTRLASEIADHFGIPCTKQNIQEWQRKWTPHFPRANADGTYNRADCFAWIETVYLPKMTDAGGSMDKLLAQAARAKAMRTIDQQKRERLELDREKGLYIFMADADRDLLGALKTYHAFVRRAIESNLPDSRRDELVRLGVTPEITALFYQFDVTSSKKTVDAIERKCEEAGASE